MLTCIAQENLTVHSSLYGDPAIRKRLPVQVRECHFKVTRGVEVIERSVDSRRTNELTVGR